MIHALGLVSLEGEVGVGRTKTPDLHCAVQARRCKCVGIFRVDGQAHHIMAVALEDLNAFPALLPIPELDRHVIGRGKDKRLSGVDDNRSNVVGMGLKGCDLFGGIVVVDTKLEVIRAANDPVLAGNEATSSHRNIGEFEGFNDSLWKRQLLAALRLKSVYCEEAHLSLIRPNVYVTYAFN